MERIWKFPLLVQDEQTLSLPAGAQLLTVQMQNGAPCLWAMVGETEAQEHVAIRMHGTGHTFDATGYVYISTFQMMGGGLVFHVFRGRAIECHSHPTSRVSPDE